MQVALKILAFDTSGQSGSVAAIEDDRTFFFKDLGQQQRIARSLAPALRESLGSAGWQASQVGLVAVTGGPGSFTGLRLGITTAKVFAYAVGAEILALDTLEVIAARIPPQVPVLRVVMGAERNQVFSACFAAGPAGWGWRQRTEITDDSDWLQRLEPGDWVSGPGLAKLATRIPAGVHVAAPELWQPTAREVGLLAFRDFQAGRRDDVWRLLPEYHRKSAAEEKRGEQ